MVVELVGSQEDVLYVEDFACRGCGKWMYIRLLAYIGNLYVVWMFVEERCLS